VGDVGSDGWKAGMGNPPGMANQAGWPIKQDDRMSSQAGWGSPLCLECIDVQSIAALGDEHRDDDMGHHQFGVLRVCATIRTVRSAALMF
jgi:hypothetical protein